MGPVIALKPHGLIDNLAGLGNLYKSVTQSILNFEAAKSLYGGYPVLRELYHIRFDLAAAGPPPIAGEQDAAKVGIHSRMGFSPIVMLLIFVDQRMGMG